MLIEPNVEFLGEPGKPLTAIRIAGGVLQEFGFPAGVAVHAAIIVAAERWTEEDTKRFGTVSQKVIRGLVEAERLLTKRELEG